MTLLEEARCRVTVVGGGRRVDVALPSRAPIAEYVTTVAALCGHDESETLPPAWSLALAGRGPLELGGSLAEAGIADGAVLYLCDILDGESVEPSVEDLREEVAQASEHFGAGPWNRARRTETAMLLGAVWLAASSLAIATTVPRADILLPAGLAFAAALACACTAWAARVRGWSAPPVLRVLTASAAIPALAAAGERLSGPHASVPALALNTALGALVGSFAVPLAAPGVAAWTLPCASTLGLVATAALGAMEVTPVECAAAVTVLCLGLTAFAPWTAGRLTASALARQYPHAVDDGAVEDLVRRSRSVLAVWNGVLAAVLAAASLVLADSRNPYALGLAGAAAIALWARSAGAAVVAEALPAAVTAAIGVLALAIDAPAELRAPWWVGPSTSTGLGCVLLLTAVFAFARGRRPEPERPAWPSRIGPLFATATVPLAVGVFGVYGHLITVGHSL